MKRTAWVRLPFLLKPEAEISFMNLKTIEKIVRNKEECSEYITGFGSDGSYQGYWTVVLFRMPNDEIVTSRIYLLCQVSVLMCM